MPENDQQQHPESNETDKEPPTEDDILRGLRKEAERDKGPSSHTARVQAWKLLGDHLGLFNHKEKKPGIAYLEFRNIKRPETIPEIPEDELKAIRGRDDREND